MVVPFVYTLEQDKVGKDREGHVFSTIVFHPVYARPREEERENKICCVTDKKVEGGRVCNLKITV